MLSFPPATCLGNHGGEHVGVGAPTPRPFQVPTGLADTRLRARISFFSRVGTRRSRQQRRAQGPTGRGYTRSSRYRTGAQETAHLLTEHDFVVLAAIDTYASSLSFVGNSQQVPAVARAHPDGGSDRSPPARRRAHPAPGGAPSLGPFSLTVGGGARRSDRFKMFRQGHPVTPRRPSQR